MSFSVGCDILYLRLSQERSDAMDNLKQWLWYTLATGYRRAAARELYQKAGSIETLYQAKKSDYTALGVTDPPLLEALCSKDLEAAERELWFAKNYNVRFLSIDDPDYPFLLKNIYDPPLLLYLRGNHFDPQNELYIAMVGTRRASDYGRKAARRIAEELAGYGVTVVGGMAEGIDSAGHIGCLDGGGKTLAVLGTGVNTVYPKNNYDLMMRIMNNGCVLSEYAFSERIFPRYFSARNRIISGLCVGTVVVEAGAKSGALITANFSLEQNRDVFAVPGNITNTASEGVNNLLKSSAKMVTCAKDIIEEYEAVYPRLIRSSPFSKNTLEFEMPAHNQAGSPEEQRVLEHLREFPLPASELALQCHMPVSQVNGLLTLLELQGKVVQHSGGLFQRK